MATSTKGAFELAFNYAFTVGLSNANLQFHFPNHKIPTQGKSWTKVYIYKCIKATDSFKIDDELVLSIPPESLAYSEYIDASCFKLIEETINY